MLHENTPLIATIVAGIVLAFIFGTLAHRFRVAPIVGYLLAGVAVGPFTPGFVADAQLTAELAEIGVILLMFGVGLHFSLEELLSVKSIAIPGAIGQITLATVLGLGLALWLGWTVSAGVVFGLALAVASTVVLLRALEDRHLLQTERGRIAVGWLIVEDLVMVFTIVLVPALTLANGEGNAGAIPSAGQIVYAVVETAVKAGAFVAVMLVVGKRAIPWLLHYVAHTGSRELFRLAVLAIALGVAYGAALLFGVSFALGAFFAGMVMSESELSQSATREALPLRDAFAVLFFVSVGMLFEPAIIIRQPLPLLATLFIILLGKSLAAYAIVRSFRYSSGTALTIAASLAQIGEFSFILASLGVSLQILPEDGRDLILAGAIASIVLNPVVFEFVERLRPRLSGAPRPQPSSVDAGLTVEPLLMTQKTDHAVVVGYGGVGRTIAEKLASNSFPFLVVEERPEIANAAAAGGIETIAGNAAAEEVLAAANIEGARALFLAIPNGFEGGQVVAQAKQRNPGLKIVARAHSDAEVEHLNYHGADSVVMGEREIAAAMIDTMFRA
jgi:monovalent cation:H+ antiporter-2, CPA2 family